MSNGIKDSTFPYSLFISALSKVDYTRLRIHAKTLDYIRGIRRASQAPLFQNKREELNLYRQMILADVRRSTSERRQAPPEEACFWKRGPAWVRKPSKTGWPKSSPSKLNSVLLYVVNNIVVNPVILSINPVNPVKKIGENPCKSVAKNHAATANLRSARANLCKFPLSIFTHKNDANPHSKPKNRDLLCKPTPSPYIASIYNIKFTILHPPSFTKKSPIRGDVWKQKLRIQLAASAVLLKHPPPFVFPIKMKTANAPIPGSGA